MASTSQNDSVRSADPPGPAPSPLQASREGGRLQDQSAQAVAPSVQSAERQGAVTGAASLLGRAVASAQNTPTRRWPRHA